MILIIIWIIKNINSIKKIYKKIKLFDESINIGMKRCKKIKKGKTKRA